MNILGNGEDFHSWLVSGALGWTYCLVELMGPEANVVVAVVNETIVDVAIIEAMLVAITVDTLMSGA